MSISATGSTARARWTIRCASCRRSISAPRAGNAITGNPEEPAAPSMERDVPANHTDHAKGLLITGIGGLALTVDIPLLKLAGGEPWSVLLLRAGVTFVAALVIWAVWRLATPSAPKLIPGRKGLVVAALYGVGSIFFITAVYNTTTANLVFILAFNTMFAALLSWLFLGERPRPATMAAMAV